MNQEIAISSKITHATLTSGEYLWIIKKDIQATVIHTVEHDCNAKIAFYLEPGSILRYHPIMSGGAKCAITISVYLQESAQFIGNGAYALTGNQECMLTTVQEHQQPSSKSTFIINGIAADNASMHYQGSIIIQKNAYKSNAMLENKTLLLGIKAKAISVPSLEVKNNDVQCAHGSAVGPLQEDQLLYIQSRGLSEQEARQLLIKSFFAQTIAGISDEKEREAILKRLMKKIIGILV